jgi:hypothetical protein
MAGVADELVAALNRLPADKRTIVPMGKARSAMHQMAECALLAGASVDMLVAKAWTMSDDFTEYETAKAKLEVDEAACLALLKENVAKLVETIKSYPTEDLDVTIPMPWGPQTCAEVAAYSYWNMYYHQGQINYIASMYGCLD